MTNETQKYRTSNKRIAKNTFYLYLRMLMVMLVSLFTVRIVLNALGAEDYGINNVVGGFVTMFAFLTSTLNSSSLRFFAYNIGKNDQVKISQYFTMSFWCFVIMAGVILILAETIGLWFVTNKLTIPSNRMDAAFWVYQFSIFTFVLKIIAIPYNSIVIAHERMNMYAILGVIECILKLGVAYLIFISPFDKLKSYTLLMFLFGALIDSYYFIYGLKNFPECHIRRFWDSKIFHEIANYSGWTLFGTLSGVFRGQGINILLNVFFNPVVNAARAIAFQINSHVNGFVMNFYKAVQPQITKSYGAGDLSSVHSLVLRSSRFCFYLILILSMPVLLETEYILKIWLKNVPEYTVLFTRLVILTAIVDSTAYPLQTSISATGRIKYFQIITGGLLILNLPIAWIFLHLGYPPQVTMYIAITISIIAQITRVKKEKKYVNLSISKYLKDVVFTISLVTIFAYVLPALTHFYLLEGHMRFFIVGIISVISCGIVIGTIGMNNQERIYFKSILNNKLHGRKHN